MFLMPRVNLIQSDEGFSVEVLGQTGISYLEGNRVLFVDAEVLSGPAGLIVYSSSIAKWEDGDEVGEAKRAQIIDNIRRAFQFRGIEIQIV
jgi:hypothetical protein